VGSFWKVWTERTCEKLKTVETPVDTPVLARLAEIDEAMSVREGVNWVYSILPDPDGPFLVADADEFILGPRARAIILDLRKLGRLIVHADSDAAATGAVAV